ncbi:nuclease [Thiocapsa imhoffii]|uniref:Nuclease n=1 Tax=Thiocapsa imhoffii TaxID=382777 RepID=A0A9X0WJB6_9GAMM|nr:NERD domain-containing protein [Thiocapsa imhoffii]MBK1645187.1 nuclease [Thiocapsa imhoffii]
MELTLILAPFWNALWWLIPLVILAGLLRSPWIKGAIGEALVRVAIRWRLDRKTYRALHDLTLPTPDGTTQIDHVLVSPYGLFVIETKNLRGWIFGGERQAQWTQKIYRHTSKFQNPLRQNYKHVKALAAALEMPDAMIHSVVVFVGASTFKTPMPANVTTGEGFVRYIRSFHEPVLSADAVEDLAQRLADRRLAPTRQTHRSHVAHLKTRANPHAKRRCPTCGNPLVLRTVKNGSRSGERFWGCSEYPKCRFTQHLG